MYNDISRRSNYHWPMSLYVLYIATIIFYNITATITSSHQAESQVMPSHQITVACLLTFHLPVSLNKRRTIKKLFLISKEDDDDEKTKTKNLDCLRKGVGEAKMESSDSSKGNPPVPC